VHAVERIRPAVREDNWQRVGSLAALVNEVDTQAINFGLELRKLIQPDLLLAPVVFVLPIVC